MSGLDPNAVWSELTRPVDRRTRYMMNYAVGAVLSAAIRARTRSIHGATSAGDSTWYGWIAPRLFRYGLQRPTREVIEEYQAPHPERIEGPTSAVQIARGIGPSLRSG